MVESQRLDMRREFSACAISMGGVDLDFSLDAPQDRRPKCADYYFPEFNVIVELKCLEKNYRADPAFSARIQSMYEAWVRDGRAPRRAGKFVMSLKLLPMSCKEEFANLLMSKIEPTFKAANKQIRKTQEILGQPHAEGVLLLVNDGNLGMPPEWVSYLVGRLLTHNKLRAINTVIHASVNEPMLVPGMDYPLQFWADLGASSTRPMAKIDFLHRFKRAWCDHLQTITGFPVEEHALDPEDPFKGGQFANLKLS